MLTRRGFLSALGTVAATAQQSDSKLFGDAEAYEKFMGRWSRLVAPPLVEFAGVRNGTRVLDVGSGTGALAFAILQRHPQCRVIGIDPAKEYVGYAANQNRFGGRASFEVGDAQEMHFSSLKFDHSVSLLVFNFIPDPLKALIEVKRTTKPGGHIAAAVWDYGSGMRMLRAFWDAAVKLDPAAEPIDEKHMKLCHSGEMAALWNKGGLTRVEERPLSIKMQFQSFADYWDPFLLGQGPAGAYTRRLDSDRQAALRAELERQLQVPANGPFTLPARVWAVRGIVRH